MHAEPPIQGSTCDLHERSLFPRLQVLADARMQEKIADAESVFS